jgi:hypothetical protein
LHIQHLSFSCIDSFIYSGKYSSPLAALAHFLLFIRINCLSEVHYGLEICQSSNHSHKLATDGSGDFTRSIREVSFSILVQFVFRSTSSALPPSKHKSQFFWIDKNYHSYAILILVPRAAGSQLKLCQGILPPPAKGW